VSREGRKPKAADNGPDRIPPFKGRPDARDFLVHVIRRVVVLAFFVYAFWVASLSMRSMFLFAPIGVAYFAGIVIVGKRVYKNSGKRRRKGKRYKFMDIEHQSGWITLFAYLAMIGGGFLLFWLWVSGNLLRQWWLAVPATVVMLAGGIFSPDKEDISGEGAAG